MHSVKRCNQIFVQSTVQRIQWHAIGKIIQIMGSTKKMRSKLKE